MIWIKIKLRLSAPKLFRMTASKFFWPQSIFKMMKLLLPTFPNLSAKERNLIDLKIILSTCRIGPKSMFSKKKKWFKSLNRHQRFLGSLYSSRSRSVAQSKKLMNNLKRKTKLIKRSLKSSRKLISTIFKRWLP